MEHDGWAAALDTALRIAGGEVVAPGRLAEPAGVPMTCAEEFARDVAGRIGVDLALALPMALSLVCVAGQGGVSLLSPTSAGGTFETPLVLHTVGLAPSGTRKSTLLKQMRAAVLPALREAVAVRAEAAAVARQEPLPAGLGTQAASDAVHAASVCPQTLVSTGTTEGVRAMLAANGGHVAVITAEGDVLREIGAYSKDGGSFTTYLDGYEQESIGTARASTASAFIEATVPFIVLVQPEVFADVVSGPLGEGMVSRGWLHRMFITTSCPMDERALLEAWAAGVGSGGAWDGALSAMAGEQAVAAMSASLVPLARRTALYRGSKAARAAWQASREIIATGLVEPPEVPRERVRLAPCAMGAFVEVQRIRVAMLARIRDAEERALVGPLAERYTNHALRLALVCALSRDPGATEVSGADLHDAATRLLPWFMAHWSTALAPGLTARAGAAAEDAARGGGRDITIDALVCKVMARMTRVSLGVDVLDRLAPPEVWFHADEIVQRGRGAVSSAKRPLMAKPLGDALRTMADEGLYVERRTGASTGSRGGRPPVQYRLTVMGARRASVDV